MPQYEKCTRCGFMDGSRYHVCLDPNPQPAVKRMVPADEDSPDPFAEARQKLWRKHSSDRDIELVERYIEGGIGYTSLAAEFNVSRSTVITIMKKAIAAGVVVSRSPGRNIKNGG